MMYEKLSTVEFLVYYPASLSVKAAVCTLYLRLSGSIRYVKNGAWAMIILNRVTCAIVFFVSLANFTKQHWQNQIQGGMDLRPFILMYNSCTIITDSVLLALPIRSLVKLHLSLRKKLGLLAIFLAGFGATISTIISLAWKVEYYYVRSLGTF